MSEALLPLDSAAKTKKPAAVQQSPQPQKKRSVLEAEAREAGLGRALGSDNVGFRLMQRMGFQPGRGLGPAHRQGRAEPLQIGLKAGRRAAGR